MPNNDVRTEGKQGEKESIESITQSDTVSILNAYTKDPFGFIKNQVVDMCQKNYIKVRDMQISAGEQYHFQTYMPEYSECQRDLEAMAVYIAIHEIIKLLAGPISKYRMSRLMPDDRTDEFRKPGQSNFYTRLFTNTENAKLSTQYDESGLEAQKTMLTRLEDTYNNRKESNQQCTGNTDLNFEYNLHYNDALWYSWLDEPNQYHFKSFLLKDDPCYHGEFVKMMCDKYSDLYTRYRGYDRFHMLYSVEVNSKVELYRKLLARIKKAKSRERWDRSRVDKELERMHFYQYIYPLPFPAHLQESGKLLYSMYLPVSIQNILMRNKLFFNEYAFGNDFAVSLWDKNPHLSIRALSAMNLVLLATMGEIETMMVKMAKEKMGPILQEEQPQDMEQMIKQSWRQSKKQLVDGFSIQEKKEIIEQMCYGEEAAEYFDRYIEENFSRLFSTDKDKPAITTTHLNKIYKYRYSDASRKDSR